MTKNIKVFFKNNYQFIYCFTLLFAILMVAINPKPYIASTFNGFSVWAKIVLPSLFAFFILTKLLMQNEKTMKVFGFLNKPFKKIYGCNYGGYLFSMSILAGYPVGASLISELYQQNKIDINEAKILCSFTSTSGPMFILGSVAVSMVCNNTIGIVILISHFLASLINGHVYKLIINKKAKSSKISINTKKCLKNTTQFNSENNTIKKQNFNEIMLNTITSCLMVGGSIALCFNLVEFLFTFLDPILNLVPFQIVNFGQIFKGLVAGIIEVTNGCLQISSCTLNPILTSTILCALISFGGLSIHLQSMVFLNKCKIKYSYFLITKITHMIISIILSLIFGIILL